MRQEHVIDGEGTYLQIRYAVFEDNLVVGALGELRDDTNLECLGRNGFC